MKPCTGIPEIDEDPETDSNIIPILQEALQHVKELEVDKDQLVYRTEQWTMIVRFDDDRRPVFNFNKWYYGKFYIYIPPTDNEEEIPYLVQKEIEKEIEIIRRLSKEFECREEGD